MTFVSFDCNHLSCSATTYSFLNSKISIELSVRVKRKTLNVSLYGAKNPEITSRKSLGRTSGLTEVEDFPHCFCLIRVKKFFIIMRWLR